MELIKDISNVFIYAVGWSVCMIGAFGIGCLVALWAIDRLCDLTKTSAIIAQWWLAKKYPNRFKG